LIIFQPLANPESGTSYFAHAKFSAMPFQHQQTRPSAFKYHCGNTEAHVLGGWLDLMVFEVFSNLWFYDSIILWFSCTNRFWKCKVPSFFCIWL